MTEPTGDVRQACLAALRQGAGGALDGLDDADSGVAAALGRFVDRARAEASGPGYPLDALCGHVGELLAGAADLDEPAALIRQLDALHAGDLHLAFACCAAIPGAAEVFEREHLARVGSYLARMRPAQTLVEEVQQQLAIKLLVRTPDGPPRIAEYSGRGPLGGWVRVAAVRLALDLQRGRAMLSLPSESRSDRPALTSDPDPELDYLKRRYGAEFRVAVREALAALPDEQRELLRLNFVEGQNIEAIGARRGVHRATVARWIAAARVAVFEDTRQRLRERLQIAPSEFESLVGMLDSQLNVSVTGLLGPPPDDSTAS